MSTFADGPVALAPGSVDPDGAADTGSAAGLPAAPGSPAGEAVDLARNDGREPAFALDGDPSTSDAPDRDVVDERPDGVPPVVSSVAPRRDPVGDPGFDGSASCVGFASDLGVRSAATSEAPSGGDAVGAGAWLTTARAVAVRPGSITGVPTAIARVPASSSASSTWNRRPPTPRRSGSIAASRWAA